MRPAVRAQIELTEEVLAVLDDAATRKRRSDAVIARSRVHGLEDMP